MAHARETVDSTKSRQEVFDYLSDFTTTAHWDPGIIRAEKITDGPIGVGTQFRVETKFMGRTTSLVYVMTAYDPPGRFVVSGENATVTSLDEITVEAVGDGSRVTYDAELTLKGPAKLFDPLLSLAFGRVADKAIAGLEKALNT